MEGGGREWVGEKWVGGGMGWEGEVGGKGEVCGKGEVEEMRGRYSEG